MKFMQLGLSINFLNKECGMVCIYPSLMAADQLNLEKEVLLLQPYCKGFHLDVMDNHFVPNMTWGAATVNALARVSNAVWVHLMVDKPMLFYEKLELPDESLVSFHIESGEDVSEFIKIIKEKKHKASIAISPKTPVERIVSCVNDVDQILLMSVEPGFSGQDFLMDSLQRLKILIELRTSSGASFRIGLDGGIDATKSALLANKGVDDYAVGSGIFQQKNSVAALRDLVALVSK
jgi:ribulose-phosphate 3-epimerase